MGHADVVYADVSTLLFPHFVHIDISSIPIYHLILNEHIIVIRAIWLTKRVKMQLGKLLEQLKKRIS